MKTISQKTFFLTAITMSVSLFINADVLFNDPGFSGEFTAVGDPFDETDSANFDKWVSKDGEAEPGSTTREWVMLETGGNSDGYASGELGNSNSYRRTMFQLVTDDKANTGLMDFSFDLNLNTAGSHTLIVGIWGVENQAGATFNFDTAPGPTFGAGSESAVGLVSQTYDTNDNTTGWERQTISNVNLGTGYDWIIVAFQSNNFSDSETLGIDNVSLAVIPEPSTFVLFGLAGLAVLLFRRRTPSSEKARGPGNR
jgi:hypothetical protein